ncbi:alsin [Prorops nasuta]|uniref:alsin n=1 Tax=Prorops nasuta TaxID=863751 RepID=UPI0034CE09F5
MEKHMYMWKGLDKLSFTFGDQPNGIICKMTTVKDHIFIVTTSKNLYHGEVILQENISPMVTFKRVQFDVIDMASNSDYLFIVNTQGHVLKVNPQNLSIVDTIILKEEARCCSHGYWQENDLVKVKSIAVNDISTLFVTDNGQLWACGNQPQIEINNTEPKRVHFFEGRIVSEIACGSNFNVAIVRKMVKVLKDDTDSDNELEEEVFVNSCPQCLNNITLCSTNSISASSTASKEHDIPSPIENSKILQTSDIIENCDESLDTILDSEKTEKKNGIFINTEAAKQFLTRQLSWVSSYGNVKEDIPLENVDRPATLIKQNVSNMANLVYEGVKNVGGKVVTLSRHMSGSSDINENKDNSNGPVIEQESETKLTNTSLALSLRYEEFPWSSSTESSEHELSQQGLSERIKILTRTGSNILSTELWTWGDIQFGQLGTGDKIKRKKPFLVTKLNNTGICKIACGMSHALVLTLDGRVFAWGKNDQKQVTLNSEEDQSSPKLFTTELTIKERARDLAAGSAHSLIMMHHGLYFLGKSNKVGDMFQLDIQTNEDCSPRRILSSGEYSCCPLINQPEINLSEDLINNQMFLEEMLVIYQNLIKSLQKKTGDTEESNIYDSLCKYFTELLSFTVLSVQSLWDYFNHIGEAYEVIIVANVEEFITIYKHYLNAICDIKSLGGFTYIAKIIEVPPVVVNLFVNILKANESKKVSNNEIIINVALHHPLIKLSTYKSTIQNLLKNNGNRMGIERLREALKKWGQMSDEHEKRQKEAEVTKAFWESAGKLIEPLRSPERRLIRESRTNPLSVLNSGIFYSHWFILLTDVFIHVTGASYTVHPLQTLWVEPLSDPETVQNGISIIAPEENFILHTPTPTERNEWLHSLQNAINSSLQRVNGHVSKLIRTSSYTFIKHSVFKDAKYTGRWSLGKPEGFGKLEWSDGRVYHGQFRKGVICGTGKMDMPGQGVYEGQWKDGQQNGYGTMKYANGDFYEGSFKDGLPHGHGIKKEGRFTASVASVYIGEWSAGMKQGYGIMDDIMTGEKYLGSWSNGMKHGCGLIVTLDGIYYEGVFVQDVLMGHGIMIFEDGTHYEGEFKSAGTFNGKGILTFRSGDRLEGNMNGSWNEGVKVIATLHINKVSGTQGTSKPISFGKLCVAPDQKWKAIFRQCYQQLGVSESFAKGGNGKSCDTQKAWQNVATILTKSHQRSLQRKKLSLNASNSKNKDENIDQLDKIPCIGKEKLTVSSYGVISKYLVKAFESSCHPLGALLTEVTTVYTATYGGVRVHPLLLSHAVLELHSITTRIYEIITIFFPVLPPAGKEHILESNGDEEGQVVNAEAILYPILLPRVHSALFVLYALHNKKEDDAYWERLIKWNKQPDITLMAFLEVDQKFWRNTNIIELSENSLSYQNESHFSEAIETLQQLKTTFSPLEKLQVVKNTFEKMTQAVQKQLGPNYLWTMDELFPVFSFIVVRASVLQLGSEIHFIEDFMKSNLQNGELGIMFTTLKACYYQILQEKMNMGD